MSLRDHTHFFNLPNAELLNAIFLFISSDQFGTSDPKNNFFFFTISIFAFSIVKLVVLSEILLHFSVLVFILYFLQATCSYSGANFSLSNTAASRVVSSAYLAKKFKSSSIAARSCKNILFHPSGSQGRVK